MGRVGATRVPFFPNYNHAVPSSSSCQFVPTLALAPGLTKRSPPPRPGERRLNAENATISSPQRQAKREEEESGREIRSPRGGGPATSQKHFDERNMATLGPLAPRRIHGGNGPLFGRRTVLILPTSLSHGRDAKPGHPLPETREFSLFSTIEVMEAGAVSQNSHGRRSIPRSKPGALIDERRCRRSRNPAGRAPNGVRLLGQPKESS